MEALPLAQQLKISADEVKSMAKKAQFMIYVSRENRLKEEDVAKIYDEWVSMVKRLKKGEEMINQYYLVVPNKWDRDADKRFTNLCNLYDFLLAMLGFYDTFFKQVLAESHYRHLMNGILEIYLN